MIAHASTNETLRVSVVLGSGTVGGGSAAERGLSLEAGNVVELTVEKLGTLRTVNGASLRPATRAAPHKSKNSGNKWRRQSHE
jgi:hypothetical protein